MSEFTEIELNELESDILDFIRTFPGKTTEDVMDAFDYVDSLTVSKTTAKLWMDYGFLKRDDITGALTARDE